MSVLAGQHVLVIGDETSQFFDIEAALRSEGAEIFTTTCDKTTPDLLSKQEIDLIIVNHLEKHSHCVDLLTQIQERRDVKVTPIFAAVQDSQQDIEHVLALGAADYFTPNETAKSIINKIRIVLGDAVNSAENTVIDIGQSHTDTDADGTKVLIVEDDPLLANLLSIRFEKAKFLYRVNTDGNNVLKDINDFEVDVVILDLMLPGTSGFNVLAEIRAHDTHKDLPVFIFSNRDSAEDKKRASDLGANGFYVKAMTDLSELIKGIEGVVSNVKK